MAACPRSDRNQAIRTFFNGFASKAVIDDIMQRNAAPTMHRCIQFLTRAERGNDKRNLPFAAHGNIFFQPVVRFVNNLVYGIGRSRTIWIVTIMRSEFFCNLMQPFVQLADWPRV